jgi:hypothetical protein
MINQRINLSPFKWHLAALLGYLLLSMGLTWPIILHWNSGLTGYIEEASRNAWNMWWWRWALEHGQNPFWTPLLYYPEGIQMYVQPLNSTTALLTMPVQMTFGLIAAHNTASLLAFALTGYGGFLLVRRFVPGVAIPFLCGAMLTAAPFHSELYALSHLNKLSIQWIPLYFWALFGLDPLFREQGAPPVGTPLRRYLPLAALAVLFFVMLTLTDWYWGFISGTFTATWVLIRLATGPHRQTLLTRYTLVGSGILLALSPLLIGIARVRERIPTADVTQNEAWREYIRGFSADALGLFFPSMVHPLWGSWMRDLLAQTSPGYHPVGWYMAAGWVLLACAGVGIWRSGRTRWRLLLAGGVMWLLSLGPVLQVAGIDTGIPLPYRLFEQIELISTARKPSHFAIICTILAAIFAGIGLHWLRQRLEPRRQPFLLLGIALLALVELWPLPPQEVADFGQPDFLHQIRAKPGAVADLPLEWQETGRVLRHQMVHEQAVVAGYVSRHGYYPTWRYLPSLHNMSLLRTWHEHDIIPLSRKTLMAMQCYVPVRHIIVTKDAETGGSLEKLRSFLTTLNGTPLHPSFEDNTYVWYELPLFQDKCQPFVYLGAGWHAREYTATKQWRWAGAAGDIWLVNPFETTVSVTLHLRAEAPGGPNATRSVELWHDEQRIAAWQVERARRDYTVVVQLPSGSNRLELRAPTTVDPQTERDVSIAVMELQIWNYYVNNK